MKIELTGIEHSERMSEETSCYSAFLIIDGKKIGTVSNDGHGGCDSFRPMGKTPEDWKADQAIYNAADSFCRTLPPIEAYGRKLSNDLEMVCAGLLEDWMIGKDFDKARRKAALAVEPGKRGVRQWGIPKGSTVDAAVASVAKNHPHLIILNTLPRAEAVALFRGAL
jgi:hypothetical protein